jgi:hypothetical protein
MDDSLINGSAHIETQGNGSIDAKELHNLNNRFTLEKYLVNKERMNEIIQIF